MGIIDWFKREEEKERLCTRCKLNKAVLVWDWCRICEFISNKRVEFLPEELHRLFNNLDCVKDDKLREKVRDKIYDEIMAKIQSDAELYTGKNKKKK